MLRKEYEAVPEGIGPVPQQEEFGSGQPTLEDVYWRRREELLKIWWMAEQMRLKSQRLASLEHDDRQPRLAMEADGQADTETRERTEGADTAVQAMHGDSCSANRVDPGPKTTSTSFDVKADPPTLPCRMAFWSTTALRRPSRLSRPWRSAQHQPPMAYFPPAKPLRQRKPSSTNHLFGSTQPKRQIYGLRFYPSRTTAVSSGRITYLLPPPAGGSSRQSQGKIGCLIQAVLTPRLPVFGNMARVALWVGYTCWSGWWQSTVLLFAGRRSAEYNFAKRGTSKSTAVFPQRLISKRAYR